MQRNEAAAVLGLDESATAAQARERAKQLESELSQKIGRAPTASLRGSYQRSLQQIAEAARAFTGDAPDGGAADLPSSDPQAGTGPAANPLGGPSVGGVGDYNEPPRKKSNAGKVAAVAGAAAIAGIATAATFAHGAEHKPEETAHHESHEHHDEEPPPPAGIDDGLLTAVLEELSTVNVETIAAEAAPPLESWMVIDDPNPPELAPEQHQEPSVFDALDPLDAVTHVEQSMQQVTIDVVSTDGLDILDLTSASASSMNIASGDGRPGMEHSGDPGHHHHAADDEDVG